MLAPSSAGIDLADDLVNTFATALAAPSESTALTVMLLTVVPALAAPDANCAALALEGTLGTLGTLGVGVPPI